MNSLPQHIRAAMAPDGTLSFARFMELALYAPGLGYYESPGRVGVRGDFITSVSVGSGFGRLLARQFALWSREMRARSDTFQVVECGAHDGLLAADVLASFQADAPDLWAQLHYILIEPSDVRREWQRQRLGPFGSCIEWRNELPDGAFTGVLFSNELLDAFPVHRLGWDAAAGHWFEWGVAGQGDRFVWRRLPGEAGRALVAVAPESVQAAAGAGVLPDGFTLEVSPGALAWWVRAARSLKEGWLVALDYGLEDAEFLDPARARGTLRAYRNHHPADDPLANPGGQDLTAHVNFSRVRQAGEEAGLETVAFASQEQFLGAILHTALLEDGGSKWDGKSLRKFQSLTHPEHMGRAFRVLVQRRRPT